MKKIFGILCMLALAGCTSTISPTGISNITEIQGIEKQFNEAEAIPQDTWANFAPEANKNVLTWEFASTDAVSINAITNVVDIEKSTDGKIRLQALGDPNTFLKATVLGKVLALQISPNQGSKVVILYLPTQTRFVKIIDTNSVIGQPGNFLYFSATNVRHIHLQSQNQMLQYLFLNNVDQASLEGIATPYLLASIQNSGDVTIHGMMGLRKLDVMKSKSVNLYWLNSPILTLNVDDHSKVFLAGITKFANAKLVQHSTLDAKYLRVNRLFIKTNDHATAEVTALDSLNALAANESNIYYYHQPKTLSRYYEDNGSVLYMGEAVPPCNLPSCPVLPRVLPG